MNKKIEQMLDIINKISKEQTSDSDFIQKGKWHYMKSYDNVMEFYRMTSETHAAPMFIFKTNDKDNNYHVILADPAENDYKGTVLSHVDIYNQLGIDIKQTEEDLIKSKDYIIDMSLIDMISYELSEHINILNACKTKDVLESVIKNILLQFSDGWENCPDTEFEKFNVENYKSTEPSSFSDNLSEDDDEDICDEDDDEDEDF